MRPASRRSIVLYMAHRRTVYVHIGLAKSGTTSLQLALQEHARGLAERGILFPGGTHGAQTVAVYDLLGRSMPGEEYPRLPGAFHRLTEEIDAWPGSCAVLSQELLALARPGHVKRLVGSLPVHHIAVVVTVRDLASAISSSYQQEIFQGSTLTWNSYVGAVRTQRDSAGLSFWMRQDLLRVLGAWERFVSPEDIHIVTVPRAGYPSLLLFERFAEVLGLPADGIVPRRAVRNASLGAAELEVLRRLNQDIAAQTGRSSRVQHLRPELRERLARGQPQPLGLPAEELAWVRAWAENLVEEVRSRRYRVIGDLSDLLPVVPPADGGPPDQVPEAELLAATARVLHAVTQEYGVLWRRNRRLRQQLRAGPAEETLADRLGYASRAAGFRIRQAALDRSERSRIIGWIGRAYLRRTARGPRDTGRGPEPDRGLSSERRSRARILEWIARRSSGG
jgi:hypothetical protein